MPDEFEKWARPHMRSLGWHFDSAPVARSMFLAAFEAGRKAEREAVHKEIDRVYDVLNQKESTDAMIALDMIRCDLDTRDG